MIRSVRRDRAIESATASSSGRSSTMSADSIATSVPEPIAMPRSAWARAAASFTPSPTIATTLPWRCSATTASCLACGSTSARTCAGSMPTSVATARAVRSLSPVSRYAVSPRSRVSVPMAGAEVPRTSSATVSAARAVPPQPT